MIDETKQELQQFITKRIVDELDEGNIDIIYYEVMQRLVSDNLRLARRHLNLAGDTYHLLEKIQREIGEK